MHTAVMGTGGVMDILFRDERSADYRKLPRILKILPVHIGRTT